jgi:uncharacterized heparinase superfamily protein
VTITAPTWDCIALSERVDPWHSHEVRVVLAIDNEHLMLRTKLVRSTTYAPEHIGGIVRGMQAAIERAVARFVLYGARPG